VRTASAPDGGADVIGALFLMLLAN